MQNKMDASKPTAPNERTTVVCRICMIQLMRSARRKRWWFPFVREPLVWGMRLLARLNGLPVKSYAASNPECRGCLRFIKADLEAKSPTFRFLNRFIGPIFQSIREPLLDPVEVSQAKEKAALMMKELESEKNKL
jgi:hypothetical protein